MKAISSSIIVLAGAIAFSIAGLTQGIGPLLIGSVGVFLIVPGFVHWQREMRREN